MFWNLKLLLTIACLGIVSFDVYSQPREQIQPDGGRWSYKKRFKDERYEGTYVRNHAGESVSLVSFTKGNIQYQNSEDQQLKLITPLVAKDANINILGSNFLMTKVGENFDYRLDMNIPAGGYRIIPMNDVINQLAIPAKNIGFYGVVREKNQNFLVPVLASTILEDSNVSWRPGIFLIKFITHDFIQKVAFNLQTIDGMNANVLNVRPTNQAIEPDTALIVTIDGTKLPQGKNWYILTINHSGNTRPINYFLYLP